MARSRFAPDRGLSTRMGLTMLLLGLLYIGFMAALIAVGFSPVFIVVIALALAWAQWYFSDRLALSAMRGRVVSPEEAPELHAVVDRLCALADMPKPKVAIADTDMPNAFATGRSPDRAVVCATTGIMRRLDQRELEGVLAHELSHVAHRDVTVMTIASVVAVLAGLMMRSMMWGTLFGGRDRRDQNTAAIFAVVMLVSVVVYFVSYLLIRALSRYRELSADRSGALLTGQPSALGSALVKISGDMGRIPTRDLRQAEAYNAFFIIPAFTKKGFSFSTLFSTHPPIEQRLDQLSKISSQLGQAG